MTGEKELVSPRTRIAVRNLMNGDRTSLAVIDDLWQGWMFSPPPEDPDIPGRGQRARRFQGYMDRVDWTDPGQVGRAVEVFAGALSLAFRDRDGDDTVDRDQLRRLFEQDGYELADDGRITKPHRPVGPSSLLTADLTNDQIEVLKGLHWGVTREDQGPAMSWPMWNFIRSKLANSGITNQRADKAIMTMPEVDAGLVRSRYSLVWRRSGGAGPIQPGDTIGLTLAGLARVDLAAADALARLAQAAAQREAELPVESHQLPSGRWDLNEPIYHSLAGPEVAGRQPMNVPTVADLLKHEPIPLAQDKEGWHLLYEVELGARLGLFRGVSNVREYLQALDTRATQPTQPSTNRATVEAPREIIEKETTAVMSSAERPEAVQPPGDRRKVFLVHGRNGKAKDAMVEFLHSLDLSVIGWAVAKVEADKTTAYPPTTLEIVSAGLQMAHAVVVLFTPDDLVCLDPRVSPGETDLQGQPRPNVILEAGMVLGMAPKKAVFVRMGAQREISDIAGMNFLNLGDTVAQRADLLRELRDSRGLAVVDDPARWTGAGKFDEALTYLSEPRPFSV